MSERPDELFHPDLDDDAFAVEPMPTPRGTPIHEETDDELVVEIDQVCLRCGYDLRGLHATGACPECNTAVIDSLRGTDLRYAEPRYVRTLLLGSSLLLVGVGMLLAEALIPCVGVAYSLPGTHAFHQLVALITSGLQLAGWWLLSTPDPALIGRDPNGVSRRIVRSASMGAGALWAFGAAVFLSGLLSNMNRVQDLLVMAASARYAALFVTFLAGLYYVQRFSERVGSEDIAQQAETIRNVTILLIVLGFVGAIGYALAGSGGAAIVLAIGTLMLSAVVGLYFWLVYSLHRVLRETMGEIETPAG